MTLWLIGIWASIASHIAPSLTPEIHTERFVQISGFPINSLANDISTIWYNINGLDMVTTMIGENGGFNKDIVSITNDHGLCQLNYRWHKDFINSTGFKDPFNQAYYCAEVWQDAVRKNRLSTTFYAYKNRKLYKNRVSIIEEKYYKIFNYKIKIDECLILKNGKQQSCQK